MIDRIATGINSQFENCVNCGTTLSQAHIIDECSTDKKLRQATLENLRRYEISLQKSEVKLNERRVLKM